MKSAASNTNQTALATGPTRTHRNHDYLQLFEGSVFPTGDVDILERSGHVLIIKSYEYKPKFMIPKAHDRIWRTLVQIGADAAREGRVGGVTVLCVMGLGSLPRLWVEYSESNPRGDGTKVGSRDDFRAHVRAWYTANRGGR